MEPNPYAEVLAGVREQINKRAGEIQARMDAALGEVNARADRHEERLGHHDARLDALEAWKAEQEAKVGYIAGLVGEAHEREGVPAPAVLETAGETRRVRLAAVDGDQVGA